jgi:hypothetical protein
MRYPWVVVFRILADATVVLHLAFVVFVLLGGVLVFWWRHVAWLHLPAVAWGAWAELSHSVCPLTPLENWLREQGGRPVYSASFVEQHLLPVLYPASLSREQQWVLGVSVVLINVAIYTVVRAWKKRPSG